MLNFIGLLIISQLAGSWAYAQLAWLPGLRPEGQKASLRRIQDPDRWLAILGDSGATGAASDPRLSANVVTLLGRAGSIAWREGIPFRAERTDEVITRVLYAPLEENKAPQSSIALDQVENTFGFAVAARLGIARGDTVFVAQDGKRVSSIPTQLERIFEMDTTTLPPLILMSYTANDFCDLGVFTDSIAERVDRFRRSLDDAWDASKPFLVSHERGTQFIVLAPLEVANVLTNPAILDQEVPLGMYGTVTCREMRRREFANAPVAEAIARALVVMCPSVLGTRVDEVDKLQRLRDIQEAFNGVWRQKIRELNRAYEAQGLRWVYLESVRHLDFETGDVANECFHPSARGHAKIADEVLKVIDAKALQSLP